MGSEKVTSYFYTIQNSIRVTSVVSFYYECSDWRLPVAEYEYNRNLNSTDMEKIDINCDFKDFPLVKCHFAGPIGKAHSS